MLFNTKLPFGGSLMNLGTLADWATVTVAVVAVFYAKHSWKSGRYSVKAAAFQERWRVYEDARRFIGAWMRNGRPDLALLPELVSAWDRSRYLFQPRVTSFLRQLWLDSIKAANWADVISGKLQGNRDEAIEKEYKMLRQISEENFLFDVFFEELHVSEPERAGLFEIR